MADVALENLVKSYPGGTTVVNRLNLAIADREFVVLVGPSGCGKSTTLRMIAGLESVSGGIIRIDGKVVNDEPPKDRDIAMVFQSYALYPHMTVFDNMSFALKLRKMSPSLIAEKVRGAARLLGIESLLDRKPKALSGGQRQRVALGRAIVRDPKCFLFDEPLSNLDARLRIEMRAELKRLHAKLAATMIYVTHDQEEAMTLGDRVVVLNDGVVQQEGPPLEVYRYPANRFVAQFLGTPPMNFFKGRVVVDRGTLCFDEGTGRIAIPTSAHPELRAHIDAEVILGIRPQALSIGAMPKDTAAPLSAETRAALSMRIDVIEPLGDTTDVILSTGRHAHVMAHIATRELDRTAELLVHFDMERAHFFDPGERGERLVHHRGNSI